MTTALASSIQHGEKSPEAFRTISEVAVDLDVPQHVLRFWEQRFAQVKPVKRAGGRRYYRPEDVDLLKGIRALLYHDGLTIKGVQKILRDRGARVAITGRSPDTTRIAHELGCDHYFVDYGSFDDVRRLADRVLQAYPRIDVLANNAGSIFSGRQVTKDGHEMTLQVNHLSGFLLTNLLRDRLEASRAVVINTASQAHLSSPLGHVFCARPGA